MGQGFGCGGGRGQGMGRGGGGGQGRGMGGGQGRGMGGGRGCGDGALQGWYFGSTPASAAAASDTLLARRRGLAERPPILAVVDGERCTGCGFCVGVCLEQAISVEGVAAIDPARCSGCGACITQCPEEALSFTRRESTTAADSNLLSQTSHTRTPNY